MSVKNISLREATELLPGRPGRSTIRRWIRFGYRGVKLGGHRVGARLYTSKQAIEQFIAATNNATGYGDAASGSGE